MASEPESRQSRNITGTILLVEHEESVLQLEQEILEAAGAAVRIAHSAQEAIGILQRDFVDAVVLDINMPGEMSTTGLYRWVEENHADLATRVVFTASSAGGEGANHGLRKTGCPFLLKPFPVEQFRKAVQESVLVAPVASTSKRQTHHRFAI